MGHLGQEQSMGFVKQRFGGENEQQNLRKLRTNSHFSIKDGWVGTKKTGHV